MKVIAALFLVAILSGCSTVTGVVRDKPTGTPISSATINVGKSSTTSDAVGHYELVGSFLPGDTLIINAPGYNMYTRTLKGSAGTKNFEDIELTPKKYN